ncbi:MAG: hypothetical protein QM790_14030 [Nibricoccus sp.]
MNIRSLAQFPRLLPLVIAFGFAWVPFLHAGTATSITGLYVTGIDGTDKGTRDDHWKLSGGSQAYVISTPASGWMANTASAKWISNTSDGFGSGTGNYTYTLTFSIAGNVGNSGTTSVSNAVVYMTLAVDDSAVITVNGGNAISTTGTSQWSNTQNVTLTNGFVIGTNTITVTVSNSGGGASGLLVSSISGAVPETGTWIPLALAAGLIIWLRLRPKRHALPAAV